MKKFGGGEFKFYEKVCVSVCSKKTGEKREREKERLWFVFLSVNKKEGEKRG
jgi:hypothetical protein